MASALAERQGSYFGVPAVPRPTVAALGPWLALVHHGCGCFGVWWDATSALAAVALDLAGSGPGVGSRGLNRGLSGVSSLSRRCLRRRLPRLLLSEIALAVCPGTCARLPALETQRELLPRPYLLALRRGEAARFKEQPALLAAARLPSSDCFFPFRFANFFFDFVQSVSRPFAGLLPCSGSATAARNVCRAKSKKLRTTLNGGSLGSCVDEERS